MPAPCPFKLAVICGGPSSERGISLNSARSVMDHLKSDSIEIIPIYVDTQKQFYQISTAQLYSNTPADFDYKLSLTAAKLDLKGLEKLLKSVDLVFPVIHGIFGEDGELQSILENLNIPFVGNSSVCCKWMFPKHQAAETLRGHGFASLPQLVLSESIKSRLGEIENFFRAHNLQRAIVKPAVGGSSIGVHSVSNPQEASDKVEEVFALGLSRNVLIEPFCKGREFTIVVFENLKGEPVALIPTEIEISYESHEIFDYRKKYLPTNQAAYHTPPRWDSHQIEHIRLQAEQIFKIFGMRDCVRLDGWLMDDGGVYFTDINPISGLEQNSFLFRQASLLGMTHGQALRYLLKRACQRYGLNCPIAEVDEKTSTKLPVYILFGNRNAERQVSLMSGTNVWLKLLQSSQYSPTPFLFDHEENIWELPYSFTLNHTVEEIYANCMNAQAKRSDWGELITTIQQNLGIATTLNIQPQSMPLSHFLDGARKKQAFVFIAMHGGKGEDGTLQKHLEEYQIPFNGSNSQISSLCMDKYQTGHAIKNLEDSEIGTLPKKIINLTELKDYARVDFENLWQQCCVELDDQQIIIKPRSDGCSAGIVLLTSFHDLERYTQFFLQKQAFIPPFSFANQSGPIEMPTSLNGEFLLEPYIETDSIVIENNQLNHFPKEGWIELTVGVLEKNGHYQALNPSITVVEGAVLSLEEKFQGGTGINLTPPPVKILSLSATNKIKRLVEKAARGLGIQNYARLDIFFNCHTEKMILIEANTLPALTPSTVIYHQGLAEEPSLTPLALLDKIIASKLSHHSS